MREMLILKLRLNTEELIILESDTLMYGMTKTLIYQYFSFGLCNSILTRKKYNSILFRHFTMPIFDLYFWVRIFA